MKYVQPIRDRQIIGKIKQILKNQSLRNYFLFVLGINTGLRIGDLLKLKVEHVRNKSHISLSEEKTGKIKRFRLNPAIQDEIATYTRDKRENEYLFASRTGRKTKPISRVMAYNILKCAGRQVGLEEIGTHTLRKTFGYHFYLETKDAALLQQIFNHSAPSVTLRYIGINQDVQDRAIENFSL